MTRDELNRIAVEWYDAVAAIQSAPGAPDYADVGRAIAMGDLMAAALAAQPAPLVCERIEDKSATYPRVDGDRAMRELGAEQVPAPPAPEPTGLVEVVRAGIPRYLQNGGCSNCGGVPHTATCLVGQLQAWLDAHDSPEPRSEDGPALAWLAATKPDPREYRGVDGDLPMRGEQA